MNNNSQKEELIKILHDIKSDKNQISKASKKLHKISKKSDLNIPKDIKKKMILKASKIYDNNSLIHYFKDSRHFDVIINAKRYPPKAIIGIASKFVTRLLHPSEFNAGHDKACFQILIHLGFEITEKINLLSSDEFNRRVEESQNQSPECRSSKVKIYKRSIYIVEYVLKRAKSICELCEEKAPFNKLNGEAYLEVHHIIQLSQKGSDTIDNTVALCPNCHRKMHTLNEKSDIEKLKLKAK